MISISAKWDKTKWNKHVFNYIKSVFKQVEQAYLHIVLLMELEQSTEYLSHIGKWDNLCSTAWVI